MFNALRSLNAFFIPLQILFFYTSPPLTGRALFKEGVLHQYKLLSSPSPLLSSSSPPPSLSLSSFLQDDESSNLYFLYFVSPLMGRETVENDGFSKPHTCSWLNKE
ncbi:UNVERIFIED_CONTAM: hypothetical protein RMT77_003948 [Armadillidium vulgare]